MDLRFHGLHPLKRFKIQQQEKSNNHLITTPKSIENVEKLICLPIKKRKHSLDSATTYCLPAKKRICAIPSKNPPITNQEPIENRKKSLSLPIKKRKQIHNSPPPPPPLLAKKRIFAIRLFDPIIESEPSKKPPITIPQPIEKCEKTTPLPIKKRRQIDDSPPPDPTIEFEPSKLIKNREKTIPLLIKNLKQIHDSPPPPPPDHTIEFEQSTNSQITIPQPIKNNQNPVNPTKKRISALPPFDLNLEYKPPINYPQKTEHENPVSTEEEDDGIFCSVCASTDGDPSDPIVLCDGCDVMVHAKCYGHPLMNGVPKGDWFCAKCLSDSNPTCCLCPNSGGALKPTIDRKWAHLVCAIFVPEVFFIDPQGREGIDCGHVPERRYDKKCCVCEESENGCVIECSEPKCLLSFHVSCGLKEKMCIEYRQGKRKGGGVVAAFCKKHTELWKKQELTGKFKIVARDDKEN